MILELMFKKWGCELESSRSGTGTLTSYCEMFDKLTCVNIRRTVLGLLMNIPFSRKSGGVFFRGVPCSLTALLLTFRRKMMFLFSGWNYAGDVFPRNFIANLSIYKTS
jgi:hypothetical protein